MIGYYGTVILGYSIVIASVIGLIRFNKILPAYRPFIIILCLGLINHTLSVIFNETIKNNAVNSNAYVLLESLLYLLLFKNWGAFNKKNVLFYSLFIFLLGLWIYDNLIWHSLAITNSLFRIVSSFILIFLSIGQLNKLIVTAKKNLFYNAIFLICCGLIIYFSYKATIEVFFFIRLEASNQFYINIFAILVFVNLFVNLIFAWAVLWIPKKQKSTLLL
jgi:hypothetical protein